MTVRILTLLLAIFLIVPQAVAENSARFIAGPISAKVLRIVDADTIDVVLRPWLFTEVTTRVRLRGVDAPETYRPKCDQEKELGINAAKFVVDLLKTDDSTAYVVLSEIGPGTYSGRVIANVITANGEDLSSLLLSRGLGVEYDGKSKRKDWCA